jgi:hypothetical protein
LKFINLNGVMQRGRRFVSSAESVKETDVVDPSKLAETIRRLQARLADVESRTPPEAIEFELTVPAAGGLVTMTHNFNTPVRWYPVQWLPSSPTAPAGGPELAHDSSSTLTDLTIRSYRAGRVVVRVEPALAPATGVAASAAAYDWAASGSTIFDPVANSATFSAITAQDILTLSPLDNSVYIWLLTVLGQSTTTPASRYAYSGTLSLRRQGAGPIDVAPTTISIATVGGLSHSNVAVGNTIVIRVTNATPANTTKWTSTAQLIGRII